MVELTRRGHVYVLTMNAGENRINRVTLDELKGALDEVERSSGPCALVTTGADKFYSNGFDVTYLLSLGPKLGEFVAETIAFFARVLTFPVPTVAVQNGHAFGAGAMFAAAHDRRLMREDKGFVCLPEVDLKMALPAGMIALLRARYPRTSVHEAVTSGARFDAPSALARGMVDRILPAQELMPAALELAESLAGKDRSTLGAIKRALYADVLPTMLSSDAAAGLAG